MLYDDTENPKGVITIFLAFLLFIVVYFRGDLQDLIFDKPNFKEEECSRCDEIHKAEDSIKKLNRLLYMEKLNDSIKGLNARLNK